ncbi:MAG: hypothetical protein HOC28_05635 [Bacteroidetes Order II. Incertae sedis bacterium]|nr:hypothetical protein [Bacteroidetes Order II. bacterium]MBT4052010.1 hypothetical protein [Bacteroidetes Order II. bacterium]MBT4602595.1 hypothetical protein [Bacteroidetes Order II. bacterium]MBT5249842.1 hypothetical protein [Bacteroidetes Order II. bacterium]MBT6199261.1 hypothetical protein [Bacteroidetes Order II. bacterium]
MHLTALVGQLLDVSDRQLWKDGSRVNLNNRYLSTLILLIQKHGQLVSKERLFEEVWSDVVDNDVVVSDVALPQGIKEIRKVLEDNAVSPRSMHCVRRDLECLKAHFQQISFILKALIRYNRLPSLLASA